METKPIYYTAFSLLEPEEKKHLSKILNALQEAPRNNEKLALYEDILSENQDALSYIFKGNKHDDSAVVARNELTLLPPRVIDRDFRVFENILLRAIAYGYQDKSQTVIKNVYVLYANCEFALSYTFVLREILGNPGLTFEQQVEFTRVLSESEDSSRINWDEFDLARYSELVPAYANFFKNSDPLKAIRSLAYLEEFFTEEHTKYVYNCIEDCLLKIYNKRLFDEYWVRFQLLPIGIQSLIGEIVSSNINLENYFNAEEEHRVFVEYAGELTKNRMYYERSLTNLAE